MVALALDIAVIFVKIQDTWPIAVPIIIRLTCHLNLVLKPVTIVQVLLKNVSIVILKNWLSPGIYKFSHRAKDHIYGYGQQSRDSSNIISATSANISHHILDPSDGIPTGPTELKVTEAFAQREMDPDEIAFLMMWCAR